MTRYLDLTKTYNIFSYLSEWIIDYRSERAYSQLKVDDGQVSASLKMGVINPAATSTKRQNINVANNAQLKIKSGEALVLSIQAQAGR